MTLLLTACCALLAFGSADLTALLPGDGVPDGWSKSGELRIFEGKELYGHINGGAEAYHALGFVALLVQDYSKGDMEVRVEIYDMGSSEGASEIFAENTAGLQTDATYGVASSLDDFQVIFYKDRFYVSVTNYTGAETEMAAMAKLADAVDEAFK